MIIGCDIDYTITDYDDEIVVLAKNYIENKGLNRRFVNPDGRIDLNYYGMSNGEWWDFYDTFGPELLSNARPKKDCKKYIDLLRKNGDKIIFLSARGESHMPNTNPYVLTYNWLKKQGIGYDKLICRDSNKLESAIANNFDLFIDDSIAVCQRLSSANIPTILFTTEINKDIKDLPNNCARANSWDEVYKIVSNLKANVNEK